MYSCITDKQHDDDDNEHALSANLPQMSLNKTQTYEEPTWLLWIGEWKLCINTHNGDEEKLVNRCGGHQDTDNIYEALIGFRERTCFVCSKGMCEPCRGEEGEGRIRQRVRGGQEDRQCPLSGFGYIAEDTSVN